jgi:hypothetical protein
LTANNSGRERFHPEVADRPRMMILRLYILHLLTTALAAIAAIDSRRRDKEINNG